MVTSVKKWGNSLGIRLPKFIADEVFLNEGTNLKISVNKGKIELTKIDSELELDDLLADINAQNLHSEIDTGVIDGNELC
jgi:antitoxin MazE